MTQTIDKLIYALGGDISDLNKAFADAEKQAASSGQKMGASMSAPLKAAASSAVADAQKLKAALGDVDKAVSNTHGSTSMATREFRALFDELSSGRTRLVPGTLAIIATRVFGVTGATLAWAAAIAAIPVALTVATVTAVSDLDRIQKKLEATGYAAGVTRNSILAIAQGLDKTSGLSERGALDIGGILAGRGNVSSGLLPSAIVATQGLSRATGSGEDKAAEELEKMLAEPAKGAAELNEQFKLLDTATTRQIEDFEQQGNTVAAQKLIIDAVNERFGHLEDSAWSLSKTFDGVGKFFSDVWFKTGATLGGVGQTDQQRLAGMQLQLRGAQDYKSRYGDSGPGANEAVSDILKNMPGEIAALQSKIAAEAATAAAGQQHASQNSAVGYGLKIADQYDKQTDEARKLSNQLIALNSAIAAATGGNAKYRDELLKERDAVATALQNQRNPAQEAALRAQEEKRLASTPEMQRARVEAEIQAQRTLRENLANPAMAPYARSIYSSQMSDAGDVKSSHAADEEMKRFANVLATITERLQIVKNTNTGLQGEAAAAGDPQAIAAAKRNAEVADELAKARKEETGLTKQQIALLEKQLAQLPQELALRDNLKAQVAGNSAVYSTNQTLANTRQRYGAAQGGAGPDQLRDLEIAQQTLDELVKDGLDPATEAFKKLFDTLVQGRVATANLNERMASNSKLGSSYASDITDPLTSLLEGRDKQKGEFGRQVGTNVAATGIKSFVTDPLQKGLSSVFGGLFGMGGKPDGSNQNPFYVTPSTLGSVVGGITGSDGGIGGMLGGIGSLFGMDGKSSGGGVFGTIAKGIGSLFGGGLASGGWIDPGKFYVVGENGPEILGPGTNGLITPMSTSPDVGQSSTPTTLNTHVTSTITVQGMGDQDILAKAQRGAEQTVRMGIEANNKSLSRTQRGSLINNNKRALT
jgi:hypothetical protein